MKFLLHLFFLIGILNLQAATVTWLGGTGNWHTPARWDTGTIPTASDDVIIPSGETRVTSGNNAFATHIHIESGAKLIVRNGGYLEVHNTHNKSGILNEGIFSCAGLVEIADITSTSVLGATGFFNEGNAIITSSGSMYIINIESNGLWNSEGAIFENRGDLFIDIVTNTGLNNRATFNNKGQITITAGSNSADGIINADQFDNYPNAHIYIYECGGDNLQNGGIGGIIANLRNRGNITLEDAGDFGIYTTGSSSLFNYQEGNITTHYAGLAGIYITAGSSITNEGSIQSYYATTHALQSTGVINNSGYLSLLFPTQTGYHSLANSSEFYNSGSTHILEAGLYSIHEDGIFHNTTEGYLTIDKNFVSSSPISNINDGFLINYYTSSHTLGSVNPLINYGVIEDPYDAFDSSPLDNQQVLFRPVIGTAQAGVAIADFLDVTALDRVDLIEWYTDNSTASPVAGTYDEVTNSFTPDLALVGQDYLYAKVEITASGNQRFIRIDLESAVVPLQASFNASAVYQNPVFESNDLSVFPNPTVGPVQLQSLHWIDKEVQLQVINTLGQVVQQLQLSADSPTIDFSFDSTLPTGLYQLQLSREGEKLATQKVVLK